MADQLDELASMIAEKALSRLRGEKPDSERIGRAEPTCVTPAEIPKECNPGGCAPCEEHLLCSAHELYNVGTARLTPLAIRTSRDLAPYIYHTLLKPAATPDELSKLCDQPPKHAVPPASLPPSTIPL